MAKQDEFDERQVAPPDNARVGDDASPLDPAQSQSETSTQEYSQEETFQTELDIDGLLNPIPTRAITELTVDKNHTTFLGLSKNYALKQYENNIIKNEIANRGCFLEIPDKSEIFSLYCPSFFNK